MYRCTSSMYLFDVNKVLIFRRNAKLDRPSNLLSRKKGVPPQSAGYHAALILGPSLLRPLLLPGRGAGVRESVHTCVDEY